ncbi:MAG TPA: hypothetical protein VHF02_00735 [Luteimonas sp.]|nr:hypothetical protein [Luteimonas sp.]
MRHSTIVRSAAVAALAVTVIAASGCHWFRKGDKAYQQSAESRPLEVPPDLDKPNTEGAVQKPADDTHSAMRSSMPAPAASTATATASGFTMAGERDDVFAKVGNALAATEGVTIASKAQLLGTYDVGYAGSNFLVRVSKVEAGVYVSAVDPRGMPATNDAATKLIAALKTALGG